MMNELISRLSGPVSKQKSLEVAAFVMTDPSRLDTLIDIFLGDDHRLCQNAAMTITCLVDHYPGSIHPYITRCIDQLDKNPIDAVKRNVLRMLQDQETPESHHGQLVQHCFDYLTNRQTAIAIQVFAMSVLANLCDIYPDLKNELRIIVEDMIPNGSGGIQSRGKKILKRLAHG
ncbi:hypothetical protein N6H18_14380 [Reichenbachiella agarivorans]|uniref:HEAT repeat-containing protein n=1 Tax=Reichenbachiella agarivorans TaxID=2979464 RepID=A0ABY6CLZ1_9BACT|nr:hypothetical protein [Reichenbachiella agarivorans]UXP31535.1 hypothetical protein N6H18_14380 [Reichenbachiella agarivorans]